MMPEVAETGRVRDIRHARAALLAGCLFIALPERATAVELLAGAVRAYEGHVEQAKRAFLSRVQNDMAPTLPADGIVVAGPGEQDGIIDVPGGLVHHWIGRAFLQRVTLRTAVDVSRRYSAYSTIYKSVVASRLLNRDGETYRVLLRLKESEAGISAVLEVRSTAHYVDVSSRVVYELSNTDEIREVKNAGERNEQLLPVGRDSGYLWRANVFTRFVQMPGGVYVEAETLGLSRRFPTMLSWILEPIARRLGRKSVETSLLEFRTAVLKEP